MFYERRATSTFQLYFLDIYEYKSRIVMACGACGTLFATDERTGEAAGFSSLLSSAERAGATIATTAERAYDRLVGKSSVDHPSPPRETTDDPLADDDAALEARFQELERKVRIAE